MRVNGALHCQLPLPVTYRPVFVLSSSRSARDAPVAARPRHLPLIWVSLWMVYALAALAYLAYQDAVAGLICGVS